MTDLIQLAIFDLDDTLVRSSIDYGKIRKFIAELFPISYKLPQINQTPILQLLSQLKTVDESLYLEARRYVEENERNAVKKASVMEGATNLPSLLDQFGIQGVIYTNNSKSNVKLYLQKPGFGFLDNFEIFTRNDITMPKPDPEGILKVMTMRNVPKKNTVYIGDSFLDSEAANNANIKFILFNSRKIDPISLKTTPFLILDDWSKFRNFMKTYSDFNNIS